MSTLKELVERKFIIEKMLNDDGSRAFDHDSFDEYVQELSTITEKIKEIERSIQPKNNEIHS